MKKTVVALTLLLCMSVSAQEVSVQEFREVFGYVLRVAETSCPEQLHPVFPEAIYYRHGYADFFDFKEAVTSLVSGPDDYLEPWHVVTLQGSKAEGFRAHYRLNEREMTLTYVSERLLVLEVSDLRATP